jgi:hypothetical protein
MRVQVSDSSTTICSQKRIPVHAAVEAGTVLLLVAYLLALQSRDSMSKMYTAQVVYVTNARQCINRLHSACLNCASC